MCGEVDDLALVFEEVELAFPVVAHYERVDVVLVDISRLLLPVVFRNDEVDVADRLEHVLALFVAEVRLLALACVELVAGESNHQVVALVLAPLEQADMPVVEQVEGSVSDDSSHCCFRPVIGAQVVGRGIGPALFYHSVISS